MPSFGDLLVSSAEPKWVERLDPSVEFARDVTEDFTEIIIEESSHLVSPNRVAGISDMNQVHFAAVLFEPRAASRSHNLVPRAW
jgi:hypothetical protein